MTYLIKGDTQAVAVRGLTQTLTPAQSHGESRNTALFGTTFDS